MSHHTQNESRDKCERDYDADVGFISKLFVQALFPYRATDELARQIRQGPSIITVFAEDGMPYGKYPRLIMAYMITTAYHQSRQVQQGLISEDQARRIPLGNSLSEFLRDIGVIKQRAAGSTIALIRKQVDRLAASSIKVSEAFKTEKTTRRKAEPTIDISHDHELWLAPDDDQSAVKTSYIELTKDFYDLIVASPIPIDLNVLKQLNKPRAMDIYTWLSVKKFWLNHRTFSTWTLTWKGAAQCFSPQELTTWQEKANFRNEIRKCMKDIAQLWPEVGVDVTKEGLVLHDGPLSVALKPKKKIGDAAD